MTMKIEEIPLIPDGLRDAAQRGTLIPFVGAGASRLAKCPSWNEFADGVFKQLIKANKFSHGQLDQIRNQPPRVKLSIARHLAEEYEFRIDYQLVFGQPRQDDLVEYLIKHVPKERLDVLVGRLKINLSS